MIIDSIQIFTSFPTALKKKISSKIPPKILHCMHFVVMSLVFSNL